MDQLIKPTKSFHCTLTVPGDKSISHRAVMLASLAEGTTEVTGFLPGEDCLSTISCFQAMGIQIQQSGDHVTVIGKGLHGLTAPAAALNCGNSGTTTRLLSGILSGQPFSSTICGDDSLQSRPMNRIALPLRQMGAQIEGQEKNGVLYAPFTITGGHLSPITYALPVASAQVKSCVLLAGLYTSGETTVIEPEPTRDHTERLLTYLGASLHREGNAITVSGKTPLTAKPISVPGDISSAAYFLCAAAICQDSSVTVQNVGVNPTRTGLLTALKQMGLSVTLAHERTVCGEPVADITCSYTPNLRPITLQGAIIPTLIDELPVLAVVACFAKGDTIIAGAQELKVKESNRIRTVVEELTKLGAHLEETEDGMIIHGGYPLHGALVKSHMDHRIAMSLAVAALAAQSPVTIAQSQCVDISFPGFFQQLSQFIR
ncbi:MAG TPA: 3-phosphoshikimate 1-carboxyvinyltransferase [Firmicutes bacterium]|mgnify:FL=1|nr:3-phosphoshikimate 1-carboxyvinyltransferase [Bacillota bacterium]